ncbi:hypothetical protein CK556_03815 [Mesoplasma chauliocola]|uniref:Cof-type HAD-IIB family hydrolase n=1 Tax=Mesoplasma chauliocola TaxID=216427 RepID=A0A249SPB0_9MOLU|nr:HAD-IIB family hydrolase [Mesoplasma chauliocola]ASZ09452.1 hypothetical protein CK556_03815 [Mesoplasma chauliocola]
MKWWISDFDGTLTLNPKTEEINKEDMDFINEWSNKNNFIIATGRDVSYINNLIKKYNFKISYKIANNGAALYKGDEVIFNKPILMNQRKEIYKILKKLHNFAGIKIADHKVCFILSGINEEEPRYDETSVLPHWFNVEDNFDKYINEVIENENLNNITLYAHLQDFDYIFDLFKDIKNIKILQTSNFVIEIMHESVSKLSGIDFLKNKYEIDDNDIIVSGDGDNDYEMLKEINNSFAMENGTKKALSAGKKTIAKVCEIKKYIKFDA